MKLFDLLESPNLGVDPPVLGVQTAVDQHTPSPIGSGTSKREAKKKKVTMMGVPVVAESGPFSYGAKKPRQGSVADLAAQKRKEQEKNKKPVEPRDHMVGVARVNKDVAESISVVDQDYDLDQMHLILDIEGKKVSFTYWDYEEDFSNAERRDVFDQLQEQPWYKGLDHPTKMEILDAAYRAIRGLEPQEYRPTVGDEPLDEQGVAEGLPQTLRKFVPGYAKREIDKKMDAGKFGRDDVAKDANFYRYKKIQDKIKEQGVAEAETGVVQTAMNKISPVKQWLLTLQKKLGTEASETKTMFDTYLRYTQGKASKQEMAAANEQFKDVVRGLGMGTLAAMPGSVITLPLVFKLAKQFNVELMPSAFRSETPSGVAEGGSGISKDQETKFHKKLDKLVHDTFGKRKDELEEVSRRDFLKGLGAAALTGAGLGAGAARGQEIEDEPVTRGYGGPRRDAASAMQRATPNNTSGPGTPSSTIPQQPAEALAYLIGFDESGQLQYVANPRLVNGLPTIYQKFAAQGYDINNYQRSIEEGRKDGKNFALTASMHDPRGPVPTGSSSQILRGMIGRDPIGNAALRMAGRIGDIGNKGIRNKVNDKMQILFGYLRGTNESSESKLYQRHQELRKKSGLPDPNYYKELKATYDLPDQERYAKAAELKKKYGVKEEVTETLGRAVPKMPKPRDPGNKILANKKNAAGKHIDKKQQQKRGIEKHRGLDIKTNLDLDEGWKSALAGAALAGATALGSPAYATEPVQQDITYVATIQTNDGLQKQINLGSSFNNNKEAYEYVDKFLKDRGIGVSFLNVAKVKTKPGEVQAKQPTQNQPQDANKDSNYLDTKPPTWKKGSGDYSEKGPYVATPTDKDYMQKMEEEKKGLYYYVNKRKKAGTSRPKDHPKAPSAQDWKDAAKTAKKNEDVSEDINESMERYLLQLRLAGYDIVQEEKVRLDPKCWKGKKIGKPKTKMKGGVRVNNCVPK